MRRIAAFHNRRYNVTASSLYPDAGESFRQKLTVQFILNGLCVRVAIKCNNALSVFLPKAARLNTCVAG